MSPYLAGYYCHGDLLGGETERRPLIRTDRVPTHTRDLLRGNRANESGRVRLEIGYWIKLDIGALEIRYQQLRDYTARMEDHCNTLIGNVQQTCSNILQIINKDNAKLALLLTHLRALYETATR